MKLKFLSHVIRAAIKTIDFIVHEKSNWNSIGKLSSLPLSFNQTETFFIYFCIQIPLPIFSSDSQNQEPTRFDLILSMSSSCEKNKMWRDPAGFLSQFPNK